ncbi:MAG: GDSL-type esterase/lipase family protein [Bacteroidales bacterium]|jgi:lysophospholipase L1-like esterase|nr:GDSL-type esterase/lipase family protein [Bacteroidales bacterium]
MKTLLLICFTLALQPLMAQKDSIPEPAELEYYYRKIAPSDSHIQYSGRVDKSNDAKYVFSHCGVSIRSSFEGSSIAAEFTEYGSGTATGTNYFTIIIDGAVQENPLQLRPEKHFYTLAENLNDSIHTIEIFKRTESQVGTVTFQGFFIEPGTELHYPRLQSNLKIEFIGNSITTGYGNAASFTAEEVQKNSGFNSVNQNNFMAWGAITTRNLIAQYSCVAYSGRGLFQNNTGSTKGTVPQFYDRVIPDSAQPLWTEADRKNFEPNYIVINVGTNDFYAERVKGRSKYVTQEKFVNAYVDFINTLRSYYPQATIICTVGVMMSDDYPKGAQQWTRIQEYVQAVRRHFVEKGDNRVLYLNLGQQTAPYGEDWHPSIATHQKMAETLTNFILRDMLNR